MRVLFSVIRGSCGCRGRAGWDDGCWGLEHDLLFRSVSLMFMASFLAYFLSFSRGIMPETRTHSRNFASSYA